MRALVRTEEHIRKFQTNNRMHITKKKHTHTQTQQQQLHHSMIEVVLDVP